ncbi:MAG: helicase, partial [Oribacterium sp.]|nr:helicase [Oribacterium sp.]
TFDSFFRKFTLNMKGKLSHEVEIGSDPSGNITRIGNAMESMTKQLEDAIAKLANVEQQLETAKIEVEKPFPQEQELNDKLTRLAELNSLLDMDEKGEDAVDLDEDAAKPEPENVTQEQVSEAEEPKDDIGDNDSQPEMDSEDIPEESEQREDVKADDKPVEKTSDRTERPSLIERLNEKKDIVASMDRKATDPQKKREEVIA